MKFIIIGKTEQLESYIRSHGGQVMLSLDSQEASVLKNPDVALPDADYLLNVYSPHILKSHVLNKFQDRAFNVHNGKLPQYAGIHVHQWAIRNGEHETAVTVHKITKEIDQGDIIAERPILISNNDTGLTLFQKTIKEGVSLMLEVVDLLLSNAYLIVKPQNITERKLYMHRDALDPTINWGKPAKEIRNFIRAGSYYPLKSPTYTASLWDAKQGEILILEAQIVDIEGEPGQLLDLNEKGPLVACGEQALRLTRVKQHRDTKINWKQLLQSY